MDHPLNAVMEEVKEVMRAEKEVMGEGNEENIPLFATTEVKEEEIDGGYGIQPEQAIDWDESEVKEGGVRDEKSDDDRMAKGRRPSMSMDSDESEVKEGGVRDVMSDDLRVTKRGRRLAMSMDSDESEVKEGGVRDVMSDDLRVTKRGRRLAMAIDSDESEVKEGGVRDETSDDIRVTNRRRRTTMASTSIEIQGTDGREREDDVFSIDGKASSIGNESMVSRRSTRNRETKSKNPAPRENGGRKKNEKEATIQPPLRYSVDNAIKYNQQFSGLPMYKQLRQSVTKYANKKYKKRRFDDPDRNIKDPRTAEEVEMRSHEGWKKWDEQFLKQGLKADYVIDYVVSTTSRKMGEKLTEQVLVKFTGYPVANWSHTTLMNTKYALTEHSERMALLDMIEFRIRAERGDRYFERHYPNRYLKYEDGEGNGGYVKNKLALAKNRLRSIESRWNFKNCQADLPEIFIEDWTREGVDDAALASLASLDFLNYLVPSEAVERLITGHEQLKDVKCCKECHTCKARARNGKEVTDCCWNYGLIDEDIECDDRCACDEKKCRNRTVQNGRQLVLCVFREPGKGWGVRTMTEIDKLSFISEYCGEVREKGLTGANHVYNFDMTHALPAENGERSPEPLVICAGERSNEARFFNHCCVPNLDVEVAVIERYGPFYHHLAFVANRRIMAGEELHFNYFEGLENKDPSFLDYTAMLGAGCTCGSKFCLFPLKKIESARKERKESQKRREETTDDEEMGDVEAPMSSRHAAQTSKARSRPKTSSRYSQPPGKRGRVDDDDVAVETARDEEMELDLMMDCDIGADEILVKDEEERECGREDGEDVNVENGEMDETEEEDEFEETEEEEEIDAGDGGRMGEDGERLPGVEHYGHSDMSYVPEERMRDDAGLSGLDDEIRALSLSDDEEVENISINGKSDRSTSRGSKRMRRDE